MLSSSLDFVDHFPSVDEPRLDRKKRHELLDILSISVAGTIAGCDGPSDIASFATSGGADRIDSDAAEGD